MTDLISRQAAIEAAYQGLQRPSNSDEWKRILEQINAIPSIEPEIIRCKDCKHRGEKPIADGRYWCELHGSFMYYCSDAER